MQFQKLDGTKLWQRIRHLFEKRVQFESLVRGNKYLIDELDETTHTYIVRYESGRTKTIPLQDLIIVYNELHEVRRIPRDYLRKNDGKNCKRLFGNKKYTHAPGASLFAILPRLDSAIDIEDGGHLRIREGHE